MTITYAIKNKPDRVEAQYVGDVQAEDVRAMFLDYKEDPHFNLSRPHLVDMRNVDAPDVGFSEIYSLFEFFHTDYAASNETLRIAFIVHADAVFGLVRIFENLVEQSNWAQCSIFSTYDEAFTWLSEMEAETNAV